MKYRIIGIAGRARVGKDTLADHIMMKGGHYNKISFADPLKTMLMVGLGLTEEQLYGNDKAIVDHRYGKTPREMMQTLGTEWGRKLVTQDIWVNAVERVITENKNDYYVIPDIRFESEADMVRNVGGIVIHVKGKTTGSSGKQHQSEQGIYPHSQDLFIDNTGSLPEYIKNINQFINEFII